MVQPITPSRIVLFRATHRPRPLLVLPAVRGTTIGGVAEAANANNTYSNNTVNTALYGIAAVGPTGNESGTVISGNTVGSAIAGNKIGLRGIAIFQQSGVTITGNTISGVSTSTTSTAMGIYISGTQSGGSVRHNLVNNTKNTNSSGYGASGIGLYSSSTTGNVTVANNMIYDVTGNGYASGVADLDNGYGIMINAGGGYKVYNNSVSLTNPAVPGNSTAINVAAAATALDIRNNTFATARRRELVMVFTPPERQRPLPRSTITTTLHQT